MLLNGNSYQLEIGYHYDSLLYLKTNLIQASVNHNFITTAMLPCYNHITYQHTENGGLDDQH